MPAIITTLLISGAMPMNWRYFLSKNMPKMRYVGVLRMRPNTGSSPKPPLLLVSLNIAISSEWLTTARLVRCCISIYLMPGKTGHRYGEHIFHAVETRAKTAGESWLWLEVLAANPAARRFYERQGMQHIRDTIFHSASQQSTLHILAKPI
ncbi:TPA: GNAT family N-acetyltransferase [Klebsiella pneumoniae]|nr:GNAT family N-acetyltransferase [Klebsiella pneumoniae]HDE1505442.1 GNAT family N-acetyltransferase [Klebsiella pneumoniae]HDE2261054.1 GNAT family N-acetyltransferase [Klebsiella pneumoniae]HDE2266552.1 GNAT family N-acetyltransferase [Klebsiella pneumoniae]HDE2272382.1 GNAT family N-acetyltransferase [Klebsiella pneumoniae]